MFFFMSLLLSCHYRQVSCGIVLFLLEKKRSPLFRGGTRVLHGAPHAREHHQIPEGPKQNNAFFFGSSEQSLHIPPMSPSMLLAKPT